MQQGMDLKVIFLLYEDFGRVIKMFKFQDMHFTGATKLHKLLVLVANEAKVNQDFSCQIQTEHTLVGYHNK